MQLVIRTRATARGRMLPRSHWRLKTVAQRPSLPVRQPPYDADFSSLFSNGGIVRGTEAKPLAPYRRRLCCAGASRARLASLLLLPAERISGDRDDRRRANCPLNPIVGAVPSLGGKQCD